MSCSIVQKLDGECTIEFRLTTKLTEDIITVSDRLEVEGLVFYITQLKKTIMGGVCYSQFIGEHISYLLNNDAYKVSAIDQSGTPTEILTTLLQGTPFSVGTVDFTESVTLRANKEATRRACLMQLVALVGGEIEYYGYTIGIRKHVGSEIPIDIMKTNLVQDISYSYNVSENTTSYNLSLYQKSGLALGDELKLSFAPLGIDSFSRIVGWEWNPFNYKEGYVRTGAMGWLVWGMCYYTLETGDRSYVGMIEKAGDWMLSRQITDKDDPRYGLMTGGIGAYNMEDYSYVDTNIEWCAVEHQCSGLQALEGCALVLKDSKYKKAAELVRDQLYLKCYDKENGRFYQGINDTAWALDCTTWAGALVFSVVNKETSFACLNTAKEVYLTTGKSIIQSTDEEHYNQAYSSDETFSGFKPYSDKTPDYAGAPDIVWSEGTLGFSIGWI